MVKVRSQNSHFERDPEYSGQSVVFWIAAFAGMMDFFPENNLDRFCLRSAAGSDVEEKRIVNPGRFTILNAYC